MLVHRAETLPAERIVRGYLAGSGWSEYPSRPAVVELQVLDAPQAVKLLRVAESDGVIEREPKPRASGEWSPWGSRRSTCCGARGVGQHRWLVGDAWHQSDYVFTSPPGRRSTTVTSAARFTRSSSVAGLPPICFHDLRHTHATLMLAQGVHPKIVSERLGHATIGITLDAYSHVPPNLQHEAARALDDFWWLIVPSRTSLSRPVLPCWAAEWQQMLTAMNRKRPREEPF